MKKIFTLLIAVSIGTICFGQTVFQSNLSSWAVGNPTDFMSTPRSSIASSNVVEQQGLATYGTSMAALINTSTTAHKRFTANPVTVVSSQTYKVEIWLACQTSGELRTNYYDATNAVYGTYNPYIDVAAASGGNLVMVTQNVTVPATCTSAEFILSLKSTDVTQASLNIGIMIDSVAITSITPPAPTIKKIYDIQYTTNPNGDSPEDGNVVTTKGVITGIVKNGPARHSFFIQDSALAWNGLYIYELNDSSLVIGDSVEVTGTVAEFNLGSAPQKVTELAFVTNITVLNQGNNLPAPVALTTMNGNSEEWEGVLISVTNSQCMSNSLGFGMWSVDDGSGAINADDDIFPYALSALVGTNYDVTGIGHYTFDEYKILPRDINDISVTVGLDEIKSTPIAVYPNPVKNNINFVLDINNFNVKIIDVTGKTIKTATSLNNKLAISTSNINNGIYFYSIYDNDGNIFATDRFIVAK